MDTTGLVAPAYREAAKSFPAFDYDPGKVGEIRAGLLEAYRSRYGDPATFEKVVVSIPGLAGEPPVRAYLHGGASIPSGRTPAIVHLHGGGWVAGSAEMMAGFCAALSRDHGAIVLSVDYRLAPETVEPGPMNDCYAALAWLHAQAEQLGIDRDRIAVLGDSAGAGLAAGMALRARDEGRYPLKAQFLIYPALDRRTGTDAAPMDNPTTGQFVVSRTYVRDVMDARLGATALDARQTTYFSPALAENLAGLPPAFIAVGSLDLFLEEDVAYAMRLSRAAVGIELHVYDGVFHGFDLVPGDVTDRFSRDLAEAIARLL